MRVFEFINLMVIDSYKVVSSIQLIMGVFCGSLKRNSAMNLINHICYLTAYWELSNKAEPHSHNSSIYESKQLNQLYAIRLIFKTAIIFYHHTENSPQYF